jgi:undecaprenyl diphosphate synthase
LEKRAILSGDGSRKKADFIPAHVGIIMDGNGRWAKKRGLARTQGHLEGLKAAKRIVKAVSDAGISYLTLYVFSTENWKRASEEVGFIMGLVKQYLRGELDFYRENGIRIRYTGDPMGLPSGIAWDLKAACEETSSFPGLQVILALNYGGRDEIVRAIKRIIKAGTPENMVSADLVHNNLDNPDVPDPDLIIRSGGDMRTSNFLLWEGAYAEYWISSKLWPDWTGDDLAEALRVFRERERRFGGVPANPSKGAGGVSV